MICLLFGASLVGCGGETTTTTSLPPVEVERTTSRPDGDARTPTGDGNGGVELVEIGSFDDPVYVTAPPGPSSDLYVVEQCGTVRLVRDGQVQQETFLDVSSEVSCGGEQGLLSIAFSPGYERDGLVYANYTNLDGDTRIVEFRRDRSDDWKVDPGSARELLAVDQPYPNHNGGQLQFGPGGLLYAGLGDGGSGGDPERSAQDPDNPLGKILQIDPGGDPGGYEVFASGLRNPWRFSFDRETGDLWIGDVGQDSLEEVNGVSSRDAEGSNFGWSAYEGTERFNEDQTAPDQVPPLLTYPNGDENCSVTGGYVSRDPGLPTLAGRYLYGDFCAGELRSFTAEPGDETVDDRPLGLRVGSLSSFGEDSAGRLYAVSLSGPVYRLIAAD